MNELIAEYKPPALAGLLLMQGDITREPADAIVNAANSALQHGGGVAAAIARAGGSIIQAESDAWVAAHGLLRHNSAAVTTAGALPARHVIHVVGPVWGSGDEPAKLGQAIRAGLRAASDAGLGCVSYPAISCGIYGYPAAQAADVFAVVFFGQPTGQHGFAGLVKMIIYDSPTLSHFKLAFDRASERAEATP